MSHWRGTFCVKLNITNPRAVSWFLDRVESLQAHLGMEYVMLEGGEGNLFEEQALRPPEALSGDKYISLLADVATRMGDSTMVTAGTRWRPQASSLLCIFYHVSYLTTRLMGHRSSHKPLFVRMTPLQSDWSPMGLKGIIPSLLHHTLLGYNFLIPDAVGNATHIWAPLFCRNVKKENVFWTKATWNQENKEMFLLHHHSKQVALFPETWSRMRSCSSAGLRSWPSSRSSASTRRRGSAEKTGYAAWIPVKNTGTSQSSFPWSLSPSSHSPAPTDWSIVDLITCKQTPTSSTLLIIYQTKAIDDMYDESWMAPLCYEVLMLNTEALRFDSGRVLVFLVTGAYLILIFEMGSVCWLWGFSAEEVPTRASAEPRPLASRTSRRPEVLPRRGRKTNPAISGSSAAAIDTPGNGSLKQSAGPFPPPRPQRLARSQHHLWLDVHLLLITVPPSDLQLTVQGQLSENDTDFEDTTWKNTLLMQLRFPWVTDKCSRMGMIDQLFFSTGAGLEQQNMLVVTVLRDKDKNRPFGQLEPRFPFRSLQGLNLLTHEKGRNMTGTTDRCITNEQIPPFFWSLFQGGWLSFFQNVWYYSHRQVMAVNVLDSNSNKTSKPQTCLASDFFWFATTGSVLQTLSMKTHLFFYIDAVKILMWRYQEC